MFALSTVAISISVANLEAYFKTIFLHRLQSSLFLLITVELRWHVHEDKAIFFPPLQPQRQSCLIENVFTAVSTNEFWIPHIECHLQIDAPTTYIFAFFDTPHILLLFCQEHGTFIGTTWKETRNQIKICICYSHDIRQPRVERKRNKSKKVLQKVAKLKKQVVTTKLQLCSRNKVPWSSADSSRSVEQVTAAALSGCV